MWSGFRPAEALAWRNADDGDDAHRDQESLNGKNVDWMENVSDEQYRKTG